MKPTVGRMVHFHARNNETGELEAYAAIVTGVAFEGCHDDCVSLATFGEGSLYFHSRVEHSEQPAHNHWTWPPRV